MKKKTIGLSVLFTSIIIALSLAGCVSKVDQTSYQNFKDLETFHLGFIDEFTQGEGKSWDAKTFEQRVKTGTEKFEAALAYETGKSKPDQTRIKAFNILYDQFKSDSEFIKSKAGLLSAFLSKQLVKQVGENYNLALKGELSRDQ
jgi:hypothetical protein